VALSVVLLSAAGQFMARLSQRRNGVGFQRDHLLLVSLEPRGSGFDHSQLTVIYRDLLGRLEAIPGVRSATLCGPTPISGAGAARFVTVEGHSEKPEERRYVSLAWVAPKYFQTLETPIQQGRDFSLQDNGRPRVAIINRSMARYYFGDRSPLGKRIRIDRDPRTGGWYGDDQPYEVVGVVADAKYIDPSETSPRTIYFNAFQEERIQSSFAIRTSVNPSSVIPAARQAISEVAKGIPIGRVTTMAEQVDASLVAERLVALLSGAFGGLGAILAAIGLYGLLAYGVARRTNEIGIRMALGATDASVSRMVMGTALKMCGAGLALGVPAAIWGTRFAAHVVEGLPLGSPLPIVFSIAATLAVAVVAGYFPARRAARLHPMDALRSE
jgi:predicted permease